MVDTSSSLFNVRIYSAMAVVVITILAFVALYLNAKVSSKAKRISIVEPQKKNQKKERRKIEGPFDATEVALHNTDRDCWIIVDGKVYDVTGRFWSIENDIHIPVDCNIVRQRLLLDYILDHPGGDSILNYAGGDSSKGVHGPQHPRKLSH